MFNPYNELMCAFTSFPSLDNKRDNGQNISRKVKKEKEILLYIIIYFKPT